MSDRARRDRFQRLEDLPRDRWRLVHAGRNRTKADVHRVGCGGEEYAVKDFRARPWAIRASLGRWSLDREERAYRALAGLAGIPALAGRPHPLVLVTAWIDGASLAALDRSHPLPPGFFARLKTLLAVVHARGVVQGDLHHRDVLVGSDGSAWLVDFSTAMVGGPGGWGPRARLWRALAAHDRRAVLKLQERFEPGTLTPEEKDELTRIPGPERLARKLRELVRRGA